MMKTMTRSVPMLALLASSALAAPAASASEHTRVTYPNAVGIEVLGRTQLWSLFYDRVLSDDLSAGFGYGSAKLDTAAGTDSGLSANQVTVYGNYYLTRQAESVFLTGGANVVTNGSSVKSLGLQTSPGAVKIKSSTVFPVLGVGFESRSDAGFLFRAAGYAIVSGDIHPWVGFSFGLAF